MKVTRLTRDQITHIRNEVLNIVRSINAYQIAKARFPVSAAEKAAQRLLDTAEAKRGRTRQRIDDALRKYRRKIEQEILFGSSEDVLKLVEQFRKVKF